MQVVDQRPTGLLQPRPRRRSARKIQRSREVEEGQEQDPVQDQQRQRSARVLSLDPVRARAETAGKQVATVTEGDRVCPRFPVLRGARRDKLPETVGKTYLRQFLDKIEGDIVR